MESPIKFTQSGGRFIAWRLIAVATASHYLGTEQLSLLPRLGTDPWPLPLCLGACLCSGTDQTSCRSCLLGDGPGPLLLWFEVEHGRGTLPPGMEQCRCLFSRRQRAAAAAVLGDKAQWLLRPIAQGQTSYCCCLTRTQIRVRSRFVWG